MPRPHVPLLLATLLCLAAAPPAVGKDAVRATIDISDAALDAAPGSTSAWRA